MERVRLGSGCRRHLTVRKANTVETNEQNNKSKYGSLSLDFPPEVNIGLKLELFS